MSAIEKLIARAHCHDSWNEMEVLAVEARAELTRLERLAALVQLPDGEDGVLVRTAEYCRKTSGHRYEERCFCADCENVRKALATARAAMAAEREGSK